MNRVLVARIFALTVGVLVIMMMLSACAPAPAPTPVPPPPTSAPVIAPTSAPITVPTQAPPPPTTAPTATAAPTAVPKPKPAGQITISDTADVRTLDPKLLLGRPDQNVLRLMFDSLYHRDDDMKIIPWLATSYENPDDRTWRFHLRKGVKFHNGNDFKANDVKFSIERLLEPDSTLDARVNVEKVVVVDDYTVDIVTKQPYAAFMTRIVLWHMTDEEYFKQVGAAGFATKPIGTGPFRFVEWVKDERVVMEANTDYWGVSPKIQRVIFKPIPEAATRTAALETGSVDIITAVPPAYVSTAPKGINVVSKAGTSAVYLGLNVKMKPFDDVRVRQAMNYAVDVETLVKTVLGGQARKMDNPLLPEAFGYTPTPVYTFNLAKAKQLLTDAGYANGFDMQIDTQPPFKEVAEAVAGQLKAAGIRANVNIMERTALYAKYEPGGSQAFFTSWGNSESDADGILSKQLWSKRAIVYTGYANAQVDTAIVGGATTVDPDKRKAFYATAIKIIVDEVPWVFLYNPMDIYGMRSRIKGWVPRADALINLDNASISE